MARIFLSHSSANNAKALALAAWLETHGWSDYFLDVDDRRGLAPGERWMAALAAAVDRCEAVIFLVSPDWQRSKYCFAEFYQARNLGKRIFGVIVEPIDFDTLPEQMTSEWQVCDLTGNDDLESFPVERRPLVPQTIVQFPGHALRRLARGLRKAGLDASTFLWPPADDPLRPPYPGLRALEEADAAVFFGRDSSIVRAIDQMRLVRERDVEKLFVILGASGAGKSSFLRAGLLPRLRRDEEHFAVLPPLRAEGAAMSGSQGLLAVLRRALKDAGQGMSQAQLRSQLVDHAGLAGLLRRIASGAYQDNPAEASDKRTIIVSIDQGEELFASDGRDETLQLLHHIESLRHAIAAPKADRLRLLLVMTIRSDSLPRLQADSVLQSLSPFFFSLPALPPSEFKAVIEGPARRHTKNVKLLQIAPELADDLVADAKGADALPLLALTLERLYHEFTTVGGTRVGRDEYVQLGGLGGVISMAVRRALERPGEEPAIPSQPALQDALLRQLFPFIATADPDTNEWKRRISTLQAIREAAPGAEALVSRLVEQRLLLTDRRPIVEQGEPVEVVEVAHEALMRQWDRLVSWLSELSESLSAAEKLRRAAKDWRQGKEDPALLVHTKGRLEAAEALLQDPRLKGRFEAVDEQYVAACRKRDSDELREREAQVRQVAEEQAKRARLQQRFTWGLIGGAAVVLAFAVWIVLQARSVGRQASLVIASAAETAADDKRYDQAFRLAVLASRHSLLQSSHPTGPAALARAADGLTLRVLLAGYRGDALPATVSPDGKRVLTGSDDGTVRVWDADTSKGVGEPMKHDGPVSSAAFSPDGKRVLTGSADGNVRVWDADTGKGVGEPMKHDGPVSSAAFSPDGKRVLTSSDDGTVRVWDADTGKAAGEPMEHDAPVNSVAFGPGGKRVLTGSDDGTVRVWDVDTGKAVGEPMKHDGPVNSAVFSPGGKRVLTSSDDKTARVWDADTGKTVGVPMKHDGLVYAAVFSPDGKRVLTGSGDKTARVWDADTGKTVGEPMKHDGPVRSAAFSPDGKRMLTGSDDGTVRVWDADTSEGVGEPMKHDGPVSSAAFSPDGKRVLTGSADGNVRVWDADNGKGVGEPMKHDGPVFGAVFSPDGKRLLTSSNDKTARVWDADTGKTVGEPMKHDGPVRSAAFSPDGKRVLTRSADRTARVWDADTGKAVGEPMKHDGPVSSAVFSPDGKRALTRSVNRTVRVWDAGTGKTVGEPMKHDRLVNSAVFSPDGKRVLTGSDDGTVRVWDADTGKAAGEPMKHDGPVSSAVFSPDGKRVLTGSADGNVRVWDATGKTVGKPMKHDGPVYGAIFSPDSKRVLTSSNDKTARVWDADTGKTVGEPMKHDGPVRSAVFSPDGKRVLTRSNDKTARVWDADTGKAVGEPMKHDGPVNSAVFSPDGKRVLTRSSDKSARVWDADTGKAVGEPMKHDGPVSSAVFSPDGKRVLTGSVDETARLWRVLSASFDNSDALMKSTCQRLNRLARSITADDVRRAPVVSPQRIGEDVCEGLTGL